MSKILAVDDEKGILTLIKNILVKDGHLVTIISNPEQVCNLDLGLFDLILLDIMMPVLDGFSLCEKIRNAVDCPIIFLTAKALEKDIMYGLGLGADDYLLKPFGIGELRARVNAHLRRENREHRTMLCLNNISFNLSGKEMLVNGKRIPFTSSEYQICEFLARNRGQVFSKDKIYETVFRFDGEGNSSSIAEHIKNIRSKLAAFELSSIETVWGVGYRWKI